MMKKFLFVSMLLLTSSFAMEVVEQSDDLTKTTKQNIAKQSHMNSSTEIKDLGDTPPTNPTKNDRGKNDDPWTTSDSEDDEQGAPTTLPIHFPTHQVDEDDDDAPINSCLCEKDYNEFASCFWNISGGWWSVLGFTAGQAATVLQILATIGKAHPATFAASTVTDMLIAAFILTEASSSLHALHAYALQTAQSRAHMANRIRVVKRKMANLHAKNSPHPKSMARTRPPVDIDGIESTSYDSCIKDYNMCTGGFWRISGGWFNVFGFLTGQTSSVLQAVSGILGGNTGLLIAATITNGFSAVTHGFEAYAYKTAAEHTKKADSIKIKDDDFV